MQNIQIFSDNNLQKMQRARGRAELGFTYKRNKSSLQHLVQSGCVKAILPKHYGSRPHGVLINTAGGVTGGDQLFYSASLGDECDLTLTTQAAERIYKSSGGMGQINVDLTLGKNAELEWLPQETILFNCSALKRKLNVEMAEGSKLSLLESVVLGRSAMGENLEVCFFNEQWRIRKNRKLIFADALKISDPKILNAKSTLDGANAFSTFLYVANDAELRLEATREMIKFDGVEAAASAWNNCLIIRFCSSSAQALRIALFEFLTRFSSHTLPRVWHM